MLEAHVIPQSEGASTSDYWVLILPTQEGVVWLSQWGGKVSMGYTVGDNC